MGTKKIQLTEDEIKRYEDFVNGKFPSNLRSRCPSCNRSFSEATALRNSHPGYCRKRCHSRGPGVTLRSKESGLSPFERKKARENRKKLREVGGNYRAQSKAFLKSQAWRTLRYRALVKYGAKCLCCGASPPDVVLHVNHIKPRVRNPELALDIDNLQILCAECNQGKGARYEDDFRGPSDG